MPQLPRNKPKNLLASALYRLKPVLPLGCVLDAAAVLNRLAFEKATEAGCDTWGANPFLHGHIKLTDRVVELGCSSGRVLSQVQAAERVGVDCDGEAIERGRRDHPGLTFIHGDARDFFQPFDVLILSHVLEHIDGPEKFLASLKGRFDRIYIEVPDFESTVLNAVRLASGRSLIYTDEDHVAEFDRDNLEAMFRNCGLKVLASEFRWGFLRYWLAWQPTS